MINKKYLKQIRSRNRSDLNYFIYEKIAKRIIDSVDLVKIPFNQILELGINENESFKNINKKFNNATFTRSDLTANKIINNSSSRYIQIDLEELNIQKNYYDLIFSNFFVHLTSNFENLIKKIHLSLKNNGLFVATIPDTDCFNELIKAMIKADL